MKFNRALGLTIVAAALVTAYGCGKEEPKKVDTPSASAAPAMPEATVKIGHVGPTTGPQAHLGKDNENGARMAIDDANAKNIVIDGKKIKFELVAEDDQADPKQGTTVAQKLVDAKVAGVVGHLNSGTTIPASKLYSDAGIPQISPSATNPKYTLQGFKTAFRVMANDVQQGSVIGKEAVTTLGAKKIASAAKLEVERCDLEPAAKLRVSLDRFDACSCVVGHRVWRRNDQITECALFASPNATT